METTRIDERVDELKKFEMEKKELEEKIKSVQAELKEVLREEGVDELRTEKYIIRNKSVVSHRFDTKKFKVEHTDLYESYLTESVSERFSIK